MADNSPKILLVEDLPYVASATVDMLKSVSPEADIQVAQSVQDVLSAPLDTYTSLIVDLGIPGVIGLSLVRELVRLGYGSYVCILTQTFSRPFIDEARKLGIRGYIGKWLPVELFREQLAHVIGGLSVFPPVDASIAAESPALTSRQCALLKLLQQGCDTRTIAGKLMLTEITVKRCIADLKLQFDAKTRAQALARAIERGLLAESPALCDSFVRQAG